MSFVFLAYPWVPVLFLLAAVCAVLTVRLRRGALICGVICIVCTVAGILLALAAAVPYTEILLLLLCVLLLFLFFRREGST